ncbi:MBL fold metallo-hydrolase [Azospirillum sp. SYSU D00513]|uniref:MBL fold metallo-hydrolase n=1 Tax=Azospirillum sp. SYSU D00513 TaxID=2812561 RepID=UPI001A956D5D|nr:MBL fold metallo-hydrolase [Azospirillum sp. SYSU D00513]
MTTRRRMLMGAAALAALPILPWRVPAAAAQAMKDEQRRTDPALLNRAPLIQTERAAEIAPGVTVIPDPRINLVPNIGIVAGRDAVLVVDTGIGVENGRRVLETARRIAAGRPLMLTLTHFHPEHGYGAQVFKGQARILYNRPQAEELRAKGPAYLAMFRGFGPDVAKALEGVEIVEPDETYEGERRIDLGGRTVMLSDMAAHTRGDQIVHLPDERIVFTGDLAENGFFPIFPDEDAKGQRWIEVLKRIEALDPKQVVAGHGAVAGPEVLRAVRAYLEDVQGEVRRLAASGAPVEEVDRRLTPLLKQRYAGWDNDMWVPFAVRVFHAEATGTPLKLPSF